MMKIPLCKPYLGKEELEAVKKVLDSGWLAHGPVGKELEEQFKKYIGCEHTIAVNSCASALHTAIVANKLKGEIILPSFTFAASANSIITAGCKPVFVDVKYDSCNIDSEKIKQKINKKTCAIMPVHYAGQSCEMNPIMELAEKHNLAVIEDSAETLGGTYKGKMTGTSGTGCFSFYPTKNITTGEGGMITTNDEKVAEIAKCLKGHGVTTTTFEREESDRPWVKDVVMPGFNFRMSDINAAIGVEQMKKIDEMNDLRRKWSKQLNKALDSIEEIETPIELKECKHTHQMYTIKINNINREKFIAAIREKGIGASVHFDPPVHLHKFYKENGFDARNLEVTEKLSNSIVTLPMFPGLKKEEVEYMAGTIKDTIKALRAKL